MAQPYSHTLHLIYMSSAKLTLDTRQRKTDGTYPVKVTISHHHQTAHISIGISLPKDDWDKRKCKCIGASKFRQAYLAQKLATIQDTMLRIRDDGQAKHMTALQLRDEILKRLNPDNQPTFGEMFKRFADSHENGRTRAIYYATLHLIRLHDESALNAKFEEINKTWLETFYTSLAERSPSVNARNIHLRNIRAVFNAAIDDGITDYYPFRRLKIRPVATRKRCLDLVTLRTILNTDGNRYIDAFRLSFYFIGMNSADLLTLTQENIVDGRIIYHRHKTHRLYSVKIPEQAKPIMEAHKGSRLLLDFAEHCKVYRHFANKANIYLHTIHPGLTMYWARHTWATIASSLDIPDDVIGLALGHAARNATTDIYIKRDTAKVDDANLKVIEYVLNGKFPTKRG